MNNRDRAGRTFNGTALNPVPGVGNRFLISTVGDGDTLHPDGESRRIHHDEHGLKAAVFFADQPAERSGRCGTTAGRGDWALAIAVKQHGSRAGLNAKLMLNRSTPDVIACPEAAIVVHQNFGYDEQR